MSDNLEPLSPSEAAKILSNSRWNRDEAHDREQTPEAASDAKFGLAAEQERAGYRPMKMAHPVKQPTADEIPQDVLTEALQQDSPTAQPIEVNYLEHDSRKPKPANE